MRTATLIAACFAAFAATANAQDFAAHQQRQQDLVALSGVFGTLHHIRRYCEPRAEADVWRERMKTMIELEAPQPAAREDMVRAFNRSYRNAQRRFPDCGRRARDHAASRALQADAIVERLTTPLYETASQDAQIIPNLDADN